MKNLYIVLSCVTAMIGSSSTFANESQSYSKISSFKVVAAKGDPKGLIAPTTPPGFTRVSAEVEIVSSNGDATIQKRNFNGIHDANIGGHFWLYKKGSSLYAKFLVEGKKTGEASMIPIGEVDGSGEVKLNAGMRYFHTQLCYYRSPYPDLRKLFNGDMDTMEMVSVTGLAKLQKQLIDPTFPGDVCELSPRGNKLLDGFKSIFVVVPKRDCTPTETITNQEFSVVKTVNDDKSSDPRLESQPSNLQPASGRQAQ